MTAPSKLTPVAYTAGRHIPGAGHQAGLRQEERVHGWRDDRVMYWTCEHAHPSHDDAIGCARRKLAEIEDGERGPGH